MIKSFKQTACALLISLLPSCAERSSAPTQVEEKVFPVQIEEVTERDVPVYIEAIGNVVAFNQVDLRPQVSGKVIDVYVHGGQDVRAGDILYQIDPIPYQLAFDKARATLEKNRAQLHYARQKFARYEQLLKSEFVSKLNIEEYASQVRTQEEQVKIDQAEAHLAHMNLSYCQIISPIEGRVSLNRIDIGNLMTANDPNALTRILQIIPIYVCFSIPQGQFQDLQHVLAHGNRTFEAILPFGSQRTFTGTLVAIDNQVNPQTGTIQLKGVIPNHEKILWPGEFVRVRLLIRTKHQVPVISASAIQLDRQGSFVYALKSNQTIEPIYVRVGEHVDDHFVVIEEGLKSGTKIVTDGHLNLRSGVKVMLADNQE